LKPVGKDVRQEKSMRMWNVDPKLLCRQHLLGEHLEMHMFLGCLKKGISLKGYVEKGLVELDKIVARHDELAAEMRARGFCHKSEISCQQDPLWFGGCIDIARSLQDLSDRCVVCKKRIERELVLLH